MAKNVAQAVSLFKQACDGNEEYGCAYLGSMYSRGEGVQKNTARALALFRQVRAEVLYQQACTQGDMDSCCNLGEMFWRGEGVKKDLGRATALFRQACGGGNARGCDQLKAMGSVPHP